jgi:hypothetical protein
MKTSKLILFRDGHTTCSETHVKHVTRMWDKMQCYYVTAGGKYNYNWAMKYYHL